MQWSEHVQEITEQNTQAPSSSVVAAIANERRALA